MGSLRIRLFLALLFMVLVALGTIVLLASKATESEFRQYLERGTVQRMRRMDATFGAYYAELGGWGGVQPLVERLAQVFGERLVLVDPSGTVVADSSRLLLGTTLGSKGPEVVAVITFHGVPVGTLRSLPPPEARAPGFEAFFLAAVNRWLLAGVLVACVAGVALSLALSRQVVKPIAALTAAARKLEKGDLTQRVQHVSSDELGELGHAFNAMADALERGEALRRNMVSDVAHELRTPLSNIRGYLEAARDHVIEADTAVITSLHEEALMLSRLVDDLQELSLAEAGQLKLLRQPMDMRSAIEQAVAMMQPEAADKQLTLSAEMPPGLPAVHADCERIGQVLRNLLANSLAYTPEGGSVTVSAHAKGKEVEVSVRDTGTGIGPQDLPCVFDRFYRADKSRARKTGGSGLGLAIVKHLVEAHGGHVWAESTPGVGSTFTFTLPVSEAATAKPSTPR